MANRNNLLRSVRIWVLIVALVLSIALICNLTGIRSDQGIGLGNGMRYGLDFAGGTEIWLKIEGENITSEVMSIERNILENRLNAMGLKDIPVSIYGNQHIIIKVAKATPEEVKAIEEILYQQANFEERIDGQLAVEGDEISVDLGTGGSGVNPEGAGYGWFVNVKLNPEGACRFGQVAQGKFFGENNPKNRPVDLYIDRPENTTILVSEVLNGLLGSVTSKYNVNNRVMTLMSTDAIYSLRYNTTFEGKPDDIYFEDTGLQVISNRSSIPVVVLGNDTNATLLVLKDYKSKGYGRVIIAEDNSSISDTVENLIEDLGIDAERIPIGMQTPDVWISGVAGLKTSPVLNFDTQGQCIYGARITGYAQTQAEATKERDSNQVWLTSGNLPRKVSIESESTIPPSLGAQFLRYSLITGIIGILSVSLVIYFRYKKLFIVIPTVVTGFSEIIIILGLAALIKWEIDLPAIAGIIAAVGTGVDNQIVITDETIASLGTARKSASVGERIRRAFFIIFTSAATIVAVMLPLMVFVAGMLKGFALITIFGVLIGVFITRPAYAKIIEELIKRRE